MKANLIFFSPILLEMLYRLPHVERKIFIIAVRLANY